MRALCWHGKADIRCDTVPDPKIEDPRDAIVKVTSCAICGSDLHLYDGFMPGMQSGDVMGHEFMGEVVEGGPGNKKLAPERLAMAEAGGATTINFEKEGVVERLNDLTDGKGPEKCIDAVGMEAHATATIDSLYDRAKQAVMLETDRPHVLGEMMYVCRPAGVLSVPGVYGGLIDKVPFGMVMNKSLTIRTGQTHVNRWTDDLLRRIEEGSDRPRVRDHPHRRAGPWPRPVQDVPREGGRLHQGGAQALKECNGGTVRCNRLRRYCRIGYKTPTEAHAHEELLIKIAA